MFVPSTLVSRGSALSGAPQACKTFSFHSNVCVGDLVAIVACSVAGIGFFFWAIHAIRKMRQFPFNYQAEDKEEPSEEHQSAGPYHVPSGFDNSLLVQRGVVQTPSLPERVRTRLALSEPEEEFYRQSIPISSDINGAQGLMNVPMPCTPRRPPPVGPRSQRISSHRLSGDRSPTRDGPYGEYIRDVGPSRASGSPLHRSGSGYGSHGIMGCRNGGSTMCAY